MPEDEQMIEASISKHENAIMTTVWTYICRVQAPHGRAPTVLNAERRPPPMLLWMPSWSLFVTLV